MTPGSQKQHIRMFVTDKVDDFLYKFVCHPIMVIYLDIQFRCLLIEQSKTLAGIMFGIQRIQIRAHRIVCCNQMIFLQLLPK